jgi:hypothetical protein
LKPNAPVYVTTKQMKILPASNGSVVGTRANEVSPDSAN